MRRALLVFVTASSLSCLGNTNEKSSPRSLDELLAPGQTRAGLITKDSELLTGTTAKGRTGDYKIYNSKISIVIAQPGTSRGYHPYGGTILDADRVRPAGAEGHSTFGETINSLDLAVLKPTTIEV